MTKISNFKYKRLQKIIVITSMQDFQNVLCPPNLVRERYHAGTSRQYETAHWSIPDCSVPFTFEHWASKLGIRMTCPIIGTKPYEQCAKRLTRPECISLVRASANQIELDPGHIQPWEKVASKYILRLLSGIDRKHVWGEWSKIRVTRSLLKDSAFCLCAIALHPVLYGRLCPMARNNRSIFLQAVALWDLPKYSIMQFVHPKILAQKFCGERPQICKDSAPNYWVFNDPEVVRRTFGKPSARRWFELQFCGPKVVEWVIRERLKHGNDVTALVPVLDKNTYIKNYNNILQG